MQRLPPEWCQMCFQLSMCFLFPIISAGRWLLQLGTIAHPPWPGEQEGLISVLLVVTGWHNVGIRNNASAERWKLSAKVLQIQIELQTIHRFSQSRRLLIESAYYASSVLNVKCESANRCLQPGEGRIVGAISVIVKTSPINCLQL